jgi:hypothetical protein
LLIYAISGSLKRIASLALFAYACVLSELAVILGKDLEQQETHGE